MAKTFGAESTTDEVLDGVYLSGNRVLVTGVSAGVGVETARTLVAHGASVVGTARDLAKARRALAEVFPQAVNDAAVDLIELNLASLKSVRWAADELLRQGKALDVIMANAGVMAVRRERRKTVSKRSSAPIIWGTSCSSISLCRC